MTPTCEHLRERLDLEAAELRPPSADLEAHVSACPACAARRARVRVLVEALRGFPRVDVPVGLEHRVTFADDPLARGVRAGAHVGGLGGIPAPDALEGFVIAALGAGSREDRAVRALDGLRSLEAPGVLDRLVRGRVPDGPRAPERRAAPCDLEQRVAEDLIRLPRAEVRRAASRQGRRTVPQVSGRIAGRRPAASGNRSLLVGFAGATLAALVLMWLQAPSGRRSVHAEPPSAVSIALPGGPGQDLSGLARGLADGLTGGLWSAQRALAADAAARRVAPAEAEPRVPLARPEPGPARVPSTTGAGRGASSPAGSRADATGGPSSSSPASGGFLGRLAASGAGVSHRIVRRVEYYLEPGSTPSLAYREEVLTDGAGNFAVDPLALVQPTPAGLDPELFLTLQKGREGFVLRHRDFGVRDGERFLANYDVTVIDSDAVVLGRPCIELDVRRSQGAERSYRLWIDSATDVVLVQEEYDALGVLLARVEAEAFEVDPDLQGVPLSGVPSRFEVLDPARPQEHPFPTTLPVAVPPGFTLTEMAGIDFDGRPWVRFLYGDGLEQVFLLIGAPARAPGIQSTGGASVGQAKSAKSHLWYFQVGAWSVLQGEIDGREVAALGKLHRSELELLLQSAVETP